MGMNCYGSRIMLSAVKVVSMVVALLGSFLIFNILQLAVLCCLLLVSYYDVVIFLCRWARRGDVWEAADLMQQMKQEGVRPDIHTYTSFINACCRAGDMSVCSSASTFLN